MDDDEGTDEGMLSVSEIRDVAERRLGRTLGVAGRGLTRPKPASACSHSSSVSVSLRMSWTRRCAPMVAMACSLYEEMVKSLIRLAPLDEVIAGWVQELSETERAMAVGGQERKLGLYGESSSMLGLVSAAGGASKPGPRQWKDSSEARRTRRRRNESRCDESVVNDFALGPVDSGVPLAAAEGEGTKMDEIDLRACLCRMDRRDVGGELMEEGASGGLMQLEAIELGEGVRENRMDQEDEVER